MQHPPRTHWLPSSVLPQLRGHLRRSGRAFDERQPSRPKVMRRGSPRSAMESPCPRRRRCWTRRRRHPRWRQPRWARRLGRLGEGLWRARQDRRWPGRWWTDVHQTHGWERCRWRAPKPNPRRLPALHCRIPPRRPRPLLLFLVSSVRRSPAASTMETIPGGELGASMTVQRGVARARTLGFAAGCPMSMCMRCALLFL